MCQTVLQLVYWWTVTGFYAFACILVGFLELSGSPVLRHLCLSELKARHPVLQLLPHTQPAACARFLFHCAVARCVLGLLGGRGHPF